MAETARRDLDRIFTTGGVAALAGNTYGAAKDVGVYVPWQEIRGLADLVRLRLDCLGRRTPGDASLLDHAVHERLLDIRSQPARC